MLPAARSKNTRCLPAPQCITPLAARPTCSHALPVGAAGNKMCNFSDPLSTTLKFLCFRPFHGRPGATLKICGVFPAHLKQARIPPLLKKASLDPDAATSYRPISYLSHMSKLIERVVATRFAEHSTTYNLLPVQQSAYRPFHSTETAIVSVFSHLVHSVDNGTVLLLILLDLSAAFDTVDHPLLLSVLVELFYGSQMVQIVSDRPVIHLRCRADA